jgi:hypothetical protein
MSRYTDYDDYDDEGDYEDRTRQWRENYAAALKSEAGRQVLTELREALMALPEHRLIESAMCTVGGPDTRAPEMTEQEKSAFGARYAGSASILFAIMSNAEQEKSAFAAQYAGLPNFTAAAAQRWAETEAEERARLHNELAELIAREGEGVCAVGAFLWHRKVREGTDPAEAFRSLPLLFDHEDGDPLTDTADLARQAGVAYELAWELAYMNDETLRGKTPQERHAAFVAWIDQQLAGTEAA